MGDIRKGALLAAVVMVLGLLFSGCTSQTGAQMKTDYLNTSWDDLVKEAKQEGTVVFNCWWGEDYWKEAAKGFEEKYAITVDVIMSDNSIDKILAKKEVKMYIPQFGMPGGGDTAGIVKNAPHKAAAMLFISHLTDEDSQLLMNDMLGSYLARTDIAAPNAILSEQDRQNYGTGWVPAAYKAFFIDEFTKNVLMNR